MFILGNFFGCVFWGTILAIIIVTVVYLLYRQFAPSGRKGIMPHLLLFVLFLFVGAQTTMTVGALYAKGYIRDISNGANSIIGNTADQVNSTVTDIESTIYQLKSQYPFAAPLLNKVDIGKATRYVEGGGRSVVDFIASNLHETANYYILRRVLWILVFISVTIGIVSFLSRNKNKAAYRQPLTKHLTRGKKETIRSNHRATF